VPVGKNIGDGGRRRKLLTSYIRDIGITVIIIIAIKIIINLHGNTDYIIMYRLNSLKEPKKA
jgi:hypothetical protein